MTLIRFIEEFLVIGYKVGFEHVGAGIYTEVTIRHKTKPPYKESDVLISWLVPSNYLRDSDRLNELKAEASELML
jgi:hypothetical protein